MGESENESESAGELQRAFRLVSPCSIALLRLSRYPVIFSITSELTISSSITQGNTSSGFLIFPGELLAACCPAKCQRSNKKVDEVKE